MPTIHRLTGGATNALKSGPRKQPGPDQIGLNNDTIGIEPLAWVWVAPEPRFQPMVDPWLEPHVCCNPDPNYRLYSLI